MAKARRIRSVSADLESEEGRADRARYEQHMARAMPPADGTLPRPLSTPARFGSMMGSPATIFATAWFAILTIFYGALVFVFDDFADDLWIPMLFLLIFVAAGVLVLVMGIKHGLRDLRLVQHGLLTWAIVTNVEQRVSTSRDSDGHTRTSITYDVHFLYGTHAGEVLRGMTNMGSASAVTDEEHELLVYNPANPYECQFADNLTGGLRLSPDGTASAESWRTVLAIVQACIISTAMLAIVSAYGWFLFAEKPQRQLPNFNRERLEQPHAGPGTG